MMRKGVLIPSPDMIIAFVVGLALTLIFGAIVLTTALHILAESIDSLAIFLERTLFAVGIPALVFLILMAWKWQIAFSFLVGCSIGLFLIIMGVAPSISI